MAFTIFRTELNKDGTVNEIHLSGQISETAQLVSAASATRRAVLITNTGSGDLFIGQTSTVSTSGANIGTKVLPGGVYAISGKAAYKGNLYAIYTVAVTSVNVQVAVKP